METIILASHSPRRQELLTQVGIPFLSDAPAVDESCALPACEAVGVLSERKARACLAQYAGRYILAADTLVSLDGCALGKPLNPEDAVRMLRLLSGRTHQVYTGVTVISPDQTVLTDTDCSHVTFCEIPESEIQAYVSTCEPLDKAGAYAIQGKAGLWVTRLEGCASSVIGLPLYLVRQLLLRAGFSMDRA